MPQWGTINEKFLCVLVSSCLSAFVVKIKE
jgi:hypothetical protein